MKLLLERQPSGLTCTIGELFLDGESFCFTLEDVIRPEKVPGETCIPPGTYRIDITWSARFQRDLPRLADVPGFTAIEMHAGNTDKDTAGCILVGTWTGGEFLHNSIQALNSLMDMLEIANISKRDITLEVRNP